LPVPARCIGTSLLIAASSNAAAVNAVAMMPGATLLTVTPRRATSMASDFPAASTALAAA
jgi:hypothetical protein